ncbi:MAG: bifunctional methylenetetrahydrofolate dehydrogenase/methenyltetrahydrofolate cyclohydrolase FolD [candidate division KSB1 bacterium]|nr:bifunctional methylenetetrahydrofolate dehydrogenase/methenyltetrahydrofolate cyclohydrolase FolD [candidate division KSB1 bacterium]
MSAILIDGKAVAEKIYAQLTEEVAELKQKGIVPRLEVILVGENPASKSYVGMKQKACEKIGIASATTHLPESTPESELLAWIDRFNQDPAVHGILVQLPLPNHISEKRILESILPEKDVDGFHPVNRGRLAVGEETFVPCTPAGMQELLKAYDFNPAGKHVVVVGRSAIVGMPFAVLMMQKKPWANATVTVCHTGSGDLSRYTRQADILAVAAGRPNTVTGDMIKPGAVVLDVGVNRVEDPSNPKGYKLVGDVDFASAVETAGAITPVPGGVGPMTIAMLLKNTVISCKKFCKLHKEMRP